MASEGVLTVFIIEGAPTQNDASPRIPVTSKRQVLGGRISSPQRAVLAPCCDPTILDFGSLTPHQHHEEPVTTYLSRDVLAPGRRIFTEIADGVAPFHVGRDLTVDPN